MLYKFVSYWKMIFRLLLAHGHKVFLMHEAKNPNLGDQAQRMCTLELIKKNYPDATLSGGVQAAQHIQQSGFSGAGCSDDSGEFSPLNIQVHPVQGAHLRLTFAVVFLQTSGLQNGLHKPYLLVLLRSPPFSLSVS